jgi:hypothetical protein
LEAWVDQTSALSRDFVITGASLADLAKSVGQSGAGRGVGITSEIINTHGSTALRLSVSFKNRQRSPIYHTGMTALASSYTKDGFVIGADSLRMDGKGQLVSENAMKLFKVRHPDFVGAYGFCGNTRLLFSEDRQMFDLLENARSVATALTALRFDSAQEYVEKFCSLLAAQLVAATGGTGLPNDFARAMFVGYSRGQAFCLQVQFPTALGRILRPRFIEVLESPVDRFCVLSGSQVVWDEMKNSLHFPETLADSVDLVTDYVTRCIENKTDPHCANIGGHLQLATVTAKGFSWVIQP